jgi:hypothetical protein
MSGADLVAAIAFCAFEKAAASYHPQTGGLISSGPLGHGFFTKTGIALPVRTSTLENHCEKSPFKTGADKGAVVICSELLMTP